MDIDYSRDSLLTNFGIETLKDRYMVPGETSPQEAFARAAIAYSDNKEHARRIYNYASNLWFMFSTPILSNGGTKRGLPISCYLSSPIPDSRIGIMDHMKENMFLASNGGGIGGYVGNLRSDGVKTSSGSQSTGSIPFIKSFDSHIMAVNQGSTRRGSVAYFQDISHPEIEEFIELRKPSGGDINRKALNIHNAVNITDKFMEAVLRGDSWSLIDPHTKETVKKVDARDLWQKILETRMVTGEPYITNIDTVNKFLPNSQKSLGLRVNGGNLCNEVLLPTNTERTAVCCLSSINLEKFDEWKDDELFIEDLVRFLDNVITSFIKEAPGELSKAVYSASQERSIGLGAMGFHSYLQKNNIPFEGPLASGINRKLFSHIHEKAIAATQKLAEERGSCPDALGEKRRNMHVIAVAPNASSSIICGGTSPSIEPIRANAYTHKTLSGSFLVKNKFLEALLEQYNQNTEEVWTSIITNKGSVQHLDFLSEWEKDVYKTAIEIDQKWIVEHAGVRQQYICQSQSVNLFFTPETDIEYLNDVHILAWKKGLKTLYYLRSESISKPRSITEKVERVIRKDSEEECWSCQG